MLTSRQLTDWIAYFSLEPWGEMRDDLRSGIIASTIANVHRDSRKHPQPYTARDFMAFVERESLDPDALSKKIRASFKGISKRK